MTINRTDSAAADYLIRKRRERIARTNAMVTRWIIGTVAIVTALLFIIL